MVVVVLGKWRIGASPILKAPEIPSPMTWNLTSAGLSNIESGGPQVAINNFVGWTW